MAYIMHWRFLQLAFWICLMLSLVENAPWKPSEYHKGSHEESEEGSHSSGNIESRFQELEEQNHMLRDILGRLVMQSQQMKMKVQQNKQEHEKNKKDRENFYKVLCEAF